MANVHGLSNPLGHNNCFLNVNVQALWHLDAFRLAFLTDGADTGVKDPLSADLDTGVHYALKAILRDYAYSADSVLPATALRQALAALWKDMGRFQLGEIDDASEALDAILSALHNSHAPPITAAASGDLALLTPAVAVPPPVAADGSCCLAHRLFALEIDEQVRCTACGATGPTEHSRLFIMYAYSAALREARAADPTLSFCRFLREASYADSRLCPSEPTDPTVKPCRAICRIFRHIHRAPPVLSVALVWESAHATADEIGMLLDCISLRMDLANVFVMEGRFAYRFRGMICYYGLHYTSFFYNPATGTWNVFDDSLVRQVGATWDEVRSVCLRGHLQPSVLFYERETGCSADEEDERVPMDAPLSASVLISSASRSSALPSFDVLASVAPSSPAMTASVLSSEDAAMMAAAVALSLESGRVDDSPPTLPAGVSADDSSTLPGVVAPLSSASVEVLRLARSSFDSGTSQVLRASFVPPGANSPSLVGGDAVCTTSPGSSSDYSALSFGSSSAESSADAAFRTLASSQPSSPSASAVVEATTGALSSVADTTTGTAPAAAPPSPSPSQSSIDDVDAFVVVLADDEATARQAELEDEQTIEITAVKTNWLYRRQERIYRFTPKHFLRLTPDRVCRDVFAYGDVASISRSFESRTIIIAFHNPAKEPQAITTPRADEIARLLWERNPTIDVIPPLSPPE